MSYRWGSIPLIARVDAYFDQAFFGNFTPKQGGPFSPTCLIWLKKSHVTHFDSDIQDIDLDKVIVIMH